ncbi:hypothetical protein [Okeania sp.]|uniref:hypothetical protein n=1 Tax=Okeania sp. TaxID=3100323 RepID=UPI002B4B2D65|nr:hypothetical protein [Okeania sp.]MEB3343761.1 hypothetical protein [Okeania sp.]
MTSNNLRELAKQGDPKVISSIINHSLQKKGINVQVIRDNGTLEITLESDQISNQRASLVEFIRTGIMKLGVESVNTVKVYGVQSDSEIPVWEEEFFLGRSSEHQKSELEEEGGDFSGIKALDQGMESGYETETDEDYDEGVYEEEGEYEDDDDELLQEPQSQKKNNSLVLKVLLGFVLVAVAAFAALYFSGIFRLPSSSQSKSENTTTPEPNLPTPENENNVADSNPWYFAVKSAESAAQKAQTAQTKSEWNEVVSDWQKAVELMKKVPESDQNYQRAQTKVSEYQNYLDTAEKRANNAPN